MIVWKIDWLGGWLIQIVMIDWRIDDWLEDWLLIGRLIDWKIYNGSEDW